LEGRPLARRPRRPSPRGPRRRGRQRQARSRAAADRLMLGLATASSPEWLARALAHLDEVLIDHAHCEKKAASTAVSLLFRYPDRTALLPVLSALAREELEHFEQMLALLERHHVAYGRLTPSPYATQLLAV